MGGCGSGRHQQRPSIEDGLTIDVAKLLRNGSTSIETGAGTLSWRNVVTDDAIASLNFSFDLCRETGTGDLRLQYNFTDPWDDEQYLVDEPIPLEGLRQPFGGWIWYFNCPVSGRRCRKLHKPPGARRFAARQVYRLLYRSQLKAPYERAIQQAQKIRKRLGASPVIGDPVYRPCGMHQSVFDRHSARLEEYEQLVVSEMNEMIVSMMYRHEKRNQS